MIEGANKGTLKECFGTGTAAVISPVGKIFYRGKEYYINEGKVGPLSQSLFDYLTGIQYGEREDIFKWTTFVDGEI